jgi:transposase-like protein
VLIRLSESAIIAVWDETHFHGEAAAYRWIERRVWPRGRVCPHCGASDHSGALRGKTTRQGLYKCYACRKPFTVKLGTIFESSHIALHLWLQAIFLLAASPRPVTIAELQQTLGIAPRSAWLMMRRIRAVAERRA